MDDRLLSLKWDNHQTTFLRNLKTLREKSSYTDATLAVEGKFYPVHKLVMSSCSEYFSDILERTFCKSPVIVLKDVQSNHIEALLDYMYLGEVNVNQNDLPSLLKTAEGLKIKGLAILDKDLTKLHKNLTSCHDDAHQNSPPPKRRRHDSNTIPQHATSPVSSPQMSVTALVNCAQTPSMQHLTSNTSNTEHNESLVKVEMDDSNDEQEGRFRRDNNYEGVARSNVDLGGDYGSDISKTEHEIENDDNTSFPRPSIQHFNNLNSNTISTEQDEPPDVKVETDDAVEKEVRFKTENHYESEHEPENDGNTTFPGPSLQQSKKSDFIIRNEPDSDSEWSDSNDEDAVISLDFMDHQEQKEKSQQEALMMDARSGASKSIEMTMDDGTEVLHHTKVLHPDSAFQNTSLVVYSNIAECTRRNQIYDGMDLPEDSIDQYQPTYSPPTPYNPPNTSCVNLLPRNLGPNEDSITKAIYKVEENLLKRINEQEKIIISIYDIITGKSYSRMPVEEDTNLIEEMANLGEDPKTRYKLNGTEVLRLMGYPTDSLEDLEAKENNLKNDKIKRKAFRFALLSKDANPLPNDEPAFRKLLRRFLNSIAPPHVWSQLNMSGRKNSDKKCFREILPTTHRAIFYNMNQIIEETNNRGSITDGTLKKFLSEVLRGTQQRKDKTSSQQNTDPENNC